MIPIIKLVVLALLGTVTLTLPAYSQSINYSEYIHWVGEASSSDASTSLAVSGDYVYIADYRKGFRVIDVSDPIHPRHMGGIDTPGYSKGIAVEGDWAYLADQSEGLHVIDIKYPDSPKIVGSVDTGGNAMDVCVNDGFVYIANHRNGLCVVDIGNPEYPQVVGTVDTPSEALGVAVFQNIVYVADFNDIVVVDVGDPRNPEIIDTIEIWARDVYVNDNYLFACGDHGLTIFNIFNPADPQGGWHRETPGTANGAFVWENLAFVADGTPGIQMIDISNLALLKMVGNFDTPDYANDLEVSNGYLYVADHESGLQVFSLGNLKVPESIGATRLGVDYTKMAVQDDLAVVAGFDVGIQIFDVSDPVIPHWRGSVDTPGYSYGVTLSGSTAFVSDGYSGLTIVDVSLPDDPRIIGNVEIPLRAMACAVDGHFAFVVDDLVGYFYVVDVGDVFAPSIVATITGGGGNSLCVNNGFAYVAGGFEIDTVDVSDPYNPVLVASDETSGWLRDVVIDGRLLYAAGAGGLTIFDVSDSGDPHFLGWSGHPGEGRGVVAAGGYAYVATSGLGLSVFDCTNPCNPLLMSSVRSGVWDISIVDDRLAMIEQSEGGYFRYFPMQCPSGLIISIVPHDLPVVIPSFGGSFGFDLTVSNNTDQVRWAKVGIEVATANRRIFPIHFLTWREYFPGQSVVFEDLIQNVPASFPSGEVYYRCWIEDDLGRIFYDGICISKTDSIGGTGNVIDPSPLDWELHGLDDDPFNIMELDSSSKVKIFPPAPNPFNPTTNMAFELPTPETVSLQVFDLQGRLVKTMLSEEVVPQGRHEAVWDGRDESGRQVASGTYFFRLEAGGRFETRRMTLLK